MKFDLFTKQNTYDYCKTKSHRKHLMTRSPREIRKDINIETAGQSAQLEIGELETVDIHIRGDAVESYDIDVRGSDEGPWVTTASASGSADYDLSFARGEAWIRVINTGGGNSANDTADVFISCS